MRTFRLKIIDISQDWFCLRFVYQGGELTKGVGFRGEFYVMEHNYSRYQEIYKKVEKFALHISLDTKCQGNKGPGEFIQ